MLEGSPARGFGPVAPLGFAFTREAHEKETPVLITAAPLLLFAQPAGLASGLGSILPILIILPVLYFLMIRPNQKKQQQWQQMLSSLKPGDRITTSGGLRGTVLALREDSLHIRVAPDGVKLEVVRSAIASVTTDEAK